MARYLFNMYTTKIHAHWLVLDVPEHISPLLNCLSCHICQHCTRVFIPLVVQYIDTYDIIQAKTSLYFYHSLITKGSPFEGPLLPAVSGVMFRSDRLTCK